MGILTTHQPPLIKNKITEKSEKHVYTEIQMTNLIDKSDFKNSGQII